MREYQGSCHCGAVKFSFVAEVVEKGLRCNCSLCSRKGAMMSAFTVSPDQMNIEAEPEQLAQYQFGSKVARHYFCKCCGIYPFHQTLRKPGHYRINLGCVEGIDSLDLPVEVIDGRNLF